MTKPAEVPNHVERQREANARLIAAAFNAATAVEALGYDGQDAIEKLPEMVEALAAFVGIAADSNGVIGWHLNGDPASWDELDLFEPGQAALPTRLAESE